MYYAQITNGTVSAVTETSGEILSPDVVAIDSYDLSLIGAGYVDGVFIKPQPVVAPIPRHITVGAFFDRFGAAKWSILADTNPGVQALIKDCSVRKYIDLDNPVLSAGLGLLIDAGHAIDATAVTSAEVQLHEMP